MGKKELNTLTLSKIKHAFNINASLNIESIFNFLKKDKELSKLERMGSGMTSVVLKSSEDKVLILTIDLSKVIYMKKTNTANFKFIKFIEYKDKVFILYEIDLLERIPEDKVVELEDEIFRLEDFSEIIYEDTIKDLSKDQKREALDIIEDMNIPIELDMNIIFDIAKKTFLDFYLDIHAGQFLFDPKKQKIVCIDPIASRNICI